MYRYPGAEGSSIYLANSPSAVKPTSRCQISVAGQTCRAAAFDVGLDVSADVCACADSVAELVGRLPVPVPVDEVADELSFGAAREPLVNRDQPML